MRSLSSTAPNPSPQSLLTGARVFGCAAQTRTSGQSYEAAQSNSDFFSSEVFIEATVGSEIPIIGTEVSVTGGASQSEGRSSESSSSRGRSSEYSVGLSSTQETGKAITVGTTVVETKEVSQSFGPAELPGCSLHVISIMAKEAKATVPWTATMKPKV